ncbi:hypothetical protein [Serratia liquefaciens]|uniref:hypothetical protein n=1 Tax=Serratia liquefaciens TaxID=614 RepID=UPI002179F845|nr:hypothetical protein [Serratia liquefaciens]CAI1917557.1 Uncharacterised protein [Serratia liquefaciens]
MDIYEWLGKLLPALIAFAGAWFGSRWGFSKYKKEKFWDATLKAYSNVLTSLEIIAFFGLADNRHRVIIHEEGVGLTNDTGLFRSAMRELIATSYSQSLYFTFEFNELVRGFIERANVACQVDYEELIGEDEDGIRDIYSKQSAKLKAVANEFLEQLSAQAKKDIRGHGIGEKLSSLKKLISPR